MKEKQHCNRCEGDKTGGEKPFCRLRTSPKCRCGTLNFKHMKMRNITILLILFLFLSEAFAADLYVVSSKEMGIENFDYTVEEIERQQSYSKLYIRNFNERSASASRWMMCAYTDLAIKRGFKNWAIYYPKEVKDQLLILFPQTESEDDPIYKKLKLDNNKPIIANIYTFAQMCGMKLEK